LWLARWLADIDRLDELRQRADRGSYHAWRALVSRLAERDMHEDLRELIASADADTRLLIFDAVGGSPPGMKALRVLADAGHKASRTHLGRRLVREGRLDELRQRADNGDEYAQHWLGEALSQ
jgi:hypothetical protein